MLTHLYHCFSVASSVLSCVAAPLVVAAVLLRRCSNLMSFPSKLEALKKFLGVAHHLRPVGFNSVLQLGEPKTLTVENRVVCPYEVPGHLCVPAKPGQAGSATTLPLSILMSLFDDISSWPCITSDDRRRPGVSVHLEASYMRPQETLAPGTLLEVSAYPQKLGRVLAFMSIECREATTNRLIATGRHTKFMQMGFKHEMAFKYLMPLIPWFSRNFGAYGRANDEALSKSASRSIMKIMEGLEPRTVSSRQTTASSFVVRGIHRNPMGGMHGGCQSLLAQLVAEHQVGHQVGDKPLLLCKEMSMTYISTGKGAVDATATLPEGEDDSIEKLGQVTTNVVITRSGSGEGKVAKQPPTVVSEGCFKFVSVNSNAKQ